MSSAATDIIIPVWNRPLETRECLAALIQYSRDFRLILLDRGSDMETEQVLHNFAEFLDTRALLLRCETSQGFVATINRGLGLATAPLVVVMRATSRVTPGWLDPFLEVVRQPAAGVLVPRLAPCGSVSSAINHPDTAARETRYGSFYAFGVTSGLYGAIGGLDESLDNDIWCLKDYSRRADRAGFQTLRLTGPPILCREEVPYGSVDRRNKKALESRAAYEYRWGEEQVYCAFLASAVSREMLRNIFEALLMAARRGHLVYVYAFPAAHRKLLSASLHRLHDSIRVSRLSRFFPSRACRSALKQLSTAHRSLRVLGGKEGLVDMEEGERVSFADFEKSISVAEV
ncbi:MAG TPA: glycosyltransferase family 2 protein [Geobacteraceae bacterium]|nr:glycosyltransferase family 2 protein [Geobacteraceae bacterium]